MVVDVTWYEAEEKNIVYHFIGHWTWQELYAALDKAALFLEKVDYPVMLIVDFRQTNYMAPANFESLNRIARADAPNHPNAKGVILIGLNRSITMVFSIFQKIFPKAAARYRVAQDEAELAALLANGEAGQH